MFLYSQIFLNLLPTPLQQEMDGKREEELPKKQKIIVVQVGWLGNG